MHQLHRLAASIASDIGLDAREIAERKRFLEFGAEDIALLKSLHDRLEPERDRFTATFYEHLLHFEPLRALVGDESGLARLRHAQTGYFSSLTAGEYGEEYVLGRLGVGSVHQRIGLDPKWYLGAYRKYVAELLPLLGEACGGDSERLASAVNALLKVILFDIGLALDTYFHHEHQEIARSERLYRAIFENAPVGVAHADLAGRFLDTNEELCRITGYGREELLHMGFADLTLPDDVPAELELLALLPHGGDAGFQRERGYLRKDGARIWVNVRIALLRGARGEAERFIAIITDITARKAAEAEVQRLNQGLEERVRERTAELEAFSYSLSHDLRTPLRSIVGFSKAMQEDQATSLDKEGLDHLARIIAAGHRMDELIEGMLGLFHISRCNPQWLPIDMGLIAQEVCNHLARSHPERTVHCEIARPLPASGDPGLLRTVLENLLGNAWKYTTHRPSARITFGMERDASGLQVFFVRDDGAGFDMQHARRLFEPFQRLHRPSDFPGNGIGLATVRRILSAHGGRIWADAEPGRGATFFFTLGEAQTPAG